jgi:alpha-tubulin suppressor-like RCC1 family protein
MSIVLRYFKRTARGMAALAVALTFQTSCGDDGPGTRPDATRDGDGAAEGQQDAASTGKPTVTGKASTVVPPKASGGAALDGGSSVADASVISDASMEPDGVVETPDGGSDASLGTGDEDGGAQPAETTAESSASTTSTTSATGSATATGSNTSPPPTGTVPPPPANCIQDIFGAYVLRDDGIALLPWTSNPQVVLDATTARPLGDVTDVMDGYYHGCAVLEDGSVSCWQEQAANGNTSGQLGNGTTTANAVIFRATPVLTGPDMPLSDVVAFAEPAISTNALNTTCAVTGEGKLWCWGDLTWLVNNGTALKSGYAQAITLDGINPLTGVTQAAFGTTGGCAVIEGAPNTIWCWGYNGYGELGQGDTVNRQYPIQVIGLSEPSDVVIANTYYGSNTVCTLDSDNVRCWGNNLYGAVGNNTTTNPIYAPSPVVIQNGTSALTGVIDIKPGTAAFSVLRTDGTMWNWGYSYDAYAANYGVTNVVDIGYAGGGGGGGPIYLTSDGVLHSAMGVGSVNCGVLE